jgi:hypothetical protein
VWVRIQVSAKIQTRRRFKLGEGSSSVKTQAWSKLKNDEDHQFQHFLLTLFRSLALHSNLFVIRVLDQAFLTLTPYGMDGHGCRGEGDRQLLAILPPIAGGKALLRTLWRSLPHFVMY